MRKRIYDPLWWSLFGAGGVISAFILPVLLLTFCLAIPLGFISPPSYANIIILLENLLIKGALVVIITFSMFHWAHRFRFTLVEGLQLHHYDKPIAYLCYTTAALTGLVSVYVLFQ